MSDHAIIDDSNHHHSPEEIKREVRVYLIVFVALAALTAVTVGSFYMLKSYPVSVAITVALIIAAVKGSLVACYFMHLISERKLILFLMLASVFFFFGVLLGPTITELDKINPIR